MSKKRKPFKCGSEAQKKAIRASYARKAQDRSQTCTNQFPDKYPFWARIKIDKKRTTLVIDEDRVYDKVRKKDVDGFVHREAIHTPNDDYEKIEPNPDPSDPAPMYLKRPRKLPKRMFEPHNKNLTMPEHLKARYDKNNHKKDK